MAMLRQLTPPTPKVHNSRSVLSAVPLNMRAWIILSVVLVSVASAQGPEPSDETFDRLAKVEVFAFGPVEYAGITSLGEKDYKVILSRPSAAVDFERLWSTGNPQARSYAMVGIRAINPERLNELSRSLRDSKVNVTTESGCIVSHESLGTVLKHIEAGESSKRAVLARPTLVEFWHVGDDGLSQRLADRVESEFDRSPTFAVGSGKKPGTLVVTIPTNVDWKLVGKRTQVFYSVEFATADNEVISKSSGSCWEDMFEKCATQIIDEAKIAAHKIEPSR
jgi:hypothetical protein